MKTHHQHKARRYYRAASAGLGLAALVWGLAGVLGGQDGPAMRFSADNSVFTPAHSSIGEAVRHFLGWRSEPEQPIAYTHQVHIQEVGLECTYCHSGVERRPVARIPSIEVCMECHLDVATDRAPIQMLTSYYERGEEPPWQRVYGWPEEAHVRFNHAPHIRAEVECATCHGDVAQMTVAERVVDHTMGFCVGCHEQNQAPNDCMTCHY